MFCYAPRTEAARGVKCQNKNAHTDLIGVSDNKLKGVTFSGVCGPSSIVIIEYTSS